MAIDKVFPRRLNTSTDARLRGQNEMIDALNVTVEENDGEFGEGGLQGASGNLGVLKPVKGTIPTSPTVDEGYYDLTGENDVVLGEVADERTSIIYSFVFSSTPDNSGVYALDTQQNLSYKVLTSKLFNFYQYTNIDADIVYVPRDGDLVPIIFFTDGRNEPKKIDIERASEAQAYSVSGFDLDFLDFVSVCPRTPLSPATFQWTKDDELNLSNFKGKRGYQFAYQNIYKSGDMSAVSSYSKLAVPPAYLQQGSRSSPALNETNKVIIRIPTSEFTDEVVSYRVLFREGNDGAWYILDDFDVDDTSIATVSDRKEIPFLANQINSILAQGISDRLFDSVPRNAVSQAVTNNRLFYGNYTEGYDLPNITASITHNFTERPDDFVSYEIGAETVIKEVNPVFLDAQAQMGSPSDPAPRNRVAGVRLDLSEIPEDGFGEGVNVSISVSVKPDRDFHFYESRRGIHKTRYLDRDGETKSNNLAEQVANEEVHEKTGAQLFGSLRGAGFKIKQHPNQPAQRIRQGIGYDPISEQYARWNTPYDSSQTDPFDVVYGTSGLSPFIIQGGLLDFSISFQTEQVVSRAQVTNIVADIMSGNTGINSSLFNTTVGGEPQRLVTVIESEIEPSYTFNLNLRQNIGYQYIDHAAQDRRAQKIIAVGRRDKVVGEGKSGKYLTPTGFFIVNSARPTFKFQNIKLLSANEEDPDEEPIIDQDPTTVLLGLDLISLGNPDILTCVPDITLRFWADIQRPNALFGGNRTLDDFRGWMAMTPTFVYNQLSSQSESWFATNFKAGGYPYTAVLTATDEFGTEVTNNLILGDIASVGRTYFNIVNGDSVFVAGDVAAGDTDQDIGKFSAVPLKADVQVNQIKRWFGVLLPAGGVAQSVSLPNGTVTTTVTGGKYIHTFTDYIQGVLEVDGANIAQDSDVLSYYASYAFSLMDGAGGVGEVHPEFIQNVFNGTTDIISSTSQIPGYKYSSVNMWAVRWGSPLFPLDSVGDTENIPSDFFNFPIASGDFTDFVNGPGNFLGLKQTTLALGALQPGADNVQAIQLEDYFDDRGGQAYGARVRLSFIDSFVTLPPPDDNTEGYYEGRSFKTGTSHDFAIIFYDQRGRASSAIPIGSEHVPTYGDAPNYGPVQMQIEFTNGSKPPEWAWSYQLAYAGNSSIVDFIQYSAGGAYVTYRTTEKTIQALEDIASQLQVLDTIDNVVQNQNIIQDIVGGIDDAYSEINLDPDAGVSDLIEQILSLRDDIQTESKKIYVSLNYLQGDPNVSYSKAFGATRFDTNPDLYTFRKGDRLRILSYYIGNDADDRIWPVNVEFEIADQVTLEDNDENPLYNDFGEVPEYLRGQFLVLKDNPAAAGFSFSDVVSAVTEDGVSPAQTAQHFWNNRCVFEIYTPSSQQVAEDRVYYEIGPKYNVIRTTASDGTLEINWQTNSSETTSGNGMIITSDGDVWFRRVPVNMPSYRTRFNNFRNLVQKDGGSSPRFADYYLETIAFTDVIPAANQMSWGRPHFVNRDYGTVKRDSSITFSDVSAPSSIRMFYTRFDATKSNFKDTDNSFGSIQAMLDLGDSVLVIQERKCSSIPISRNTLSDVVGGDIIVASEKVMGSQRFYAGNYGCDVNPESVKMIGNNVYFANKKMGEVYRWNPSNGITIISENGLKTYFRTMFDQLLAEASDGGFVTKVVGGYNPIYDEYIISAHNRAAVAVTEDYNPIQPTGTQDDVVPIVDPDLDTTTTDQTTIAELLAANAALQLELDELQDLYDSLQSNQTFITTQIAEQLNNDLAGDISDEASVVINADLQDELDDTINQIDEIEQTVVINIEAQQLVHAEIHRNAQEKVGPDGSLFAFADYVQTIQDRPDLASEEYQLPPLYVANYVEGGELDVPVYVSAAEYGSAIIQVQQELFQLDNYWIESEAVYLDRLGNENIYTVGYGAGPVPDINSGIALVEDFMQNISLAITVADALTTFFGVAALEDFEEIISSKDEVISDQQDDIDGIMGEIADYIGAIKDVAIDSPDKPDAEIFDLYPFGVSFPQGQTNVFLAYYEARDTDIANGAEESGSYPALKELVLNSALGLSQIRTNLERGIGGVRSEFQNTINDNFEAIDGLTIARNSLAATAFNALNTMYVDLFGKPQIGQTLPAGISSLITNEAISGSVSPQNLFQIQQILEAFADGDGVIGEENTVGSQQIFDAFNQGLQDLLGDSTAGTTEALDDATKGALKNLLDEAALVANQLSVSFPDTYVSVIEAGNQTQIQTVLQGFADTLNGESGNSVRTGVSKIKDALTSARQNINIFGQLSNSGQVGAGDFQFAVGTPNDLQSIEYIDAFVNDADNVAKALTDFQKLFSHFSDNTSPSAGLSAEIVQGSQDAVGYADAYAPVNNEEGGIRAKDILNISNKSIGNDVISSFVAVERALAAINLRVTNASNNNNVLTITEGGSDVTYTPLGINQTAIQFEGDGLDLLPDGIEEGIDILLDAVAPDDGDGGDGGNQGGGGTIFGTNLDLAQNVVSLVNKVIKDLGFGFSDGLTSQYAVPSIQAQIFNNIGDYTLAGDQSGIQYGRDNDGDGLVNVGDLLLLLSSFGQPSSDPNVAFQSFANYIYALASDEFKSRVDVNTLNNFFNGITNAPGVTIEQDTSTGLFSYSYVEPEGPTGS